ncbi:hypothetical protein AU210_014098 [Fusarium oxysporum f. sp. radicis-cucumerinum]|uniref:Uncharacterized protein n=2 Tax=Fusarium oxysporum TaxID=5507 RepID=A0A2H3G1T9_FUSOX|nr:hypothetical protein AU210_014098 [Fusarium oxysporum f. sp. radicis-cucumerinum]
MEQGLNPDPIRKAAERIQHEVLSKGGGGYVENVWQEIFRKRFFDQLTDSLSLSKEDSRRVSRSIYYYDQVASQIDKAVTDRLQVIVTNGSSVTTQVEALHRVEATAQLPLRSQREETTQSSNSTQESQIPEVDNDDPDDSDYHPTSSESRSRSPSDAHTDDGDARSEVAVSVASTSAFSFSSFSKDTTVVWRPPSDPETPKTGSRSKKGSERPDILHRQSSQPSEDSDDATPKPTTVGHGVDFNLASPISGSPLERLGKNALDGPPVLAGRSPPGQPKWPPGRKFVSPKTQSSPKAPMHRGDIIPSPPADPKAKLYIDLTSDSQRDHPNTKE